MYDELSLDDIGMAHGTDKSSIYHNYLNFYEIFFKPFRQIELKILEIGVLNGASLKTWEQYFPTANIIGADIASATKRFEQGRIAIEILDQSNLQDLANIALKHGPFDVIIEDGSHMWEHQIISLKSLFPFVKSGGIYIVEDLQTNFGAMATEYRGIARLSCVEYLKSWVDLCVADDQLPVEEIEDPFLRTFARSIEFITFHKRACLIKKSFPTLESQTNIGSPLDPTGKSNSIISILGHFSSLGDIHNDSNFLNPPSDEFALQGIAILSREEFLEYKVRSANNPWSEWSRINNFAGSRGQSKVLTGVAFRLRPEMVDRFALRVLCRFAGHAQIFESSDGQECESPTNSALCGIQIELTEL